MLDAVSELRAREWWPAEYCDETMPPGMPTPEGFVFRDGARWMLGYAPASGADAAEAALFNRAIEPGDIVNFVSCDDLGEVEVTFGDGGTYTPLGPVPAEHNWCRIAYDQDTLADSLDALAQSLGAEFREASDTWTVQFARWSDEIPFRLVLIDGVPRFARVTAGEARQ